jgi:hypothetical protein
MLKKISNTIKKMQLQRKLWSIEHDLVHTEKVLISHKGYLKELKKEQGKVLKEIKQLDG